MKTKQIFLLVFISGCSNPSTARDVGLGREGQSQDGAENRQDETDRKISTAHPETEEGIGHIHEYTVDEVEVRLDRVCRDRMRAEFRVADVGKSFDMVRLASGTKLYS